MKKGGINYERIHRILTSDEILYGKHLILKAEKTDEIRQSRFEKRQGI